MSHACTPILVGIAIPVSEILQLSKTAKFPFLTMDYSPWSSKNLIKYMYMYMYITFIYIIKYFNVFNVHFPLSVPVPVIDFSCCVMDGK